MKRTYWAAALATSMIAAAALTGTLPVAAQTHEHKEQERPQPENGMPTTQEMHQQMMQYMRSCMKGLEGEKGSMPSDQSPMHAENMQQMRERMMKHMDTCMNRMGKEGSGHMHGAEHKPKSSEPDPDDANHDHNHGK